MNCQRHGTSTEKDAERYFAANTVGCCWACGPLRVCMCGGMAQNFANPDNSAWPLGCTSDCFK